MVFNGYIFGQDQTFSIFWCAKAACHFNKTLILNSLPKVCAYLAWRAADNILNFLVFLVLQSKSQDLNYFYVWYILPFSWRVPVYSQICTRVPRRNSPEGRMRSLLRSHSQNRYCCSENMKSVQMCTIYLIFSILSLGLSLLQPWDFSLFVTDIVRLISDPRDKILILVEK